MKESAAIDHAKARRRAAASVVGTRGFSMMEVLISILLLSLGLLGMAGLQTASLRTLNQTRIQASANRLGHELAELMQGNRLVALSNTNNPYLLDTGDPEFHAQAAGNDCLSADCTDARQQARWEVASWNRQLRQAASGLPQARVVSCLDEAPYDSAGLPRWSCSNSGETVIIKLGWPGSSLGEALDQAPRRPALIIRAVGGVGP